MNRPQNARPDATKEVAKEIVKDNGKEAVKESVKPVVKAAEQKDCEWICPETDDLEIYKGRKLENHINYGGYEARLASLGCSG